MRYLTEVGAPFERVRERAASDGDRLLSAAARRAAVLQGVHASGWLAGPGRRLRLHLVWDSAHSTPTAPSLDGEIEISAFGPDRTRVAMSAQVDVPTGNGKESGWPVAEGRVKEFVDAFAAALAARDVAA